MTAFATRANFSAKALLQRRSSALRSAELDFEGHLAYEVDGAKGLDVVQGVGVIGAAGGSISGERHKPLRT